MRAYLAITRWSPAGDHTNRDEESNAGLLCRFYLVGAEWGQVALRVVERRGARARGPARAAVAPPLVAHEPFTFSAAP